MAGTKQRSAKKTRLVNNIVVHVVLAILAIIWVFPILWVTDQLPCRKGLLCIDLPAPELYA